MERVIFVVLSSLHLFALVILVLSDHAKALFLDISKPHVSHICKSRNATNFSAAL